MRSSTRPTLRTCVVLLTIVTANAFWNPPAFAGDGSVLRIARSTDGLRFTPVAQPLFEGGSSPALEQLPDGDLILVFDHEIPPVKGTRCESLRISRSQDEGRTWSTPDCLRLGGRGVSRRVPRHGDVIARSDGAIQLYFVANARSAAGRSKGDRSTVIRSAISRDGSRFEVVDDIALRCRGLVEPQAATVQRDRSFVMFLSERNGAAFDKNQGDPSRTLRAVSRDGRRFARTAPVEFDGEFNVTDLVTEERGLRAYGWNSRGVVSYRSADGSTWEIEDGLRLAGGWDPAVVRLQRGGLLMVYADGSPPKPLLKGTAAVAANGATYNNPSDVDTFASDPFLQHELVTLEDGTSLTVDEWDAGLESGEPDPDGLAPQPDFVEPVDYTQWYREHALEQTDDNAFDAYVAFMPRFDEDGVPDREDWPQFNDMFNGQTESLPIQPWKPDEHPDWEETHQSAQEALTKFRDANLRMGYATRVDPTPDSDPNGPAEARLLLNLQLPHLAPHRTLAKATLADAWRVETDGKPSPQRMIDAWKTVLRGAEHVERGSTLIENLVGVAERGLVESNARWALQRGVFGEKELEQAYDALRQYDRNATDVVKGVRGEHAMALDTTQYLFSPPDAEGQPVINPDRVERLKEIMGDESGASREEVEAMDPNDARSTVDAFNNYYREVAEQMRVGYPEIRAADLDALERQYVGTSPITKILLPSLSRVHALRARAEASRRATQLAYAVHLQHARTGQWPKTLDELPNQFGDEIRTDPFTGRPFGYRLGPDGPTIYSMSENGIDDGGVHSPRWNDALANPGDSDDYVFWPPQN